MENKKAQDASKFYQGWGRRKKAKSSWDFFCFGIIFPNSPQIDSTPLPTSGTFLLRLRRPLIPQGGMSQVTKPFGTWRRLDSVML